MTFGDYTALLAALSFAIALLSLLVAAASAAYTRQQASETRRLRAIEADRWHHEQTPALELVQVGRRDDSHWFDLHNHGPTSLDAITLGFPAGTTSSGPVRGIGASFEGGHARSLEFGALALGQHRGFSLLKNTPSAFGHFVIVAECRRGDLPPWEVMLRGEVPPPLGSQVW